MAPWIALTAGSPPTTLQASLDGTRDWSKMRTLFLLWAVFFTLAGVGCNAKEIDGDLGIATVGDLCNVDGYYACSRDGTAELICVDNAFEPSQTCEGGCEVVIPPHSPDTLPGDDTVVSGTRGEPVTSRSSAYLVCRGEDGTQK